MDCEDLIEGCQVRISPDSPLHPGSIGTLSYTVPGGKHAVLVASEEEVTIFDDEYLKPV